MHHANKGMIGLKLDALDTGIVKNCRVYKTQNLGLKGRLADGNEAYNKGIGKSNSTATYNGYGGANVRGISLASSKYVVVEDSGIFDTLSNNGMAIACDIHLDSSYITINNLNIKDVQSLDITPTIAHDCDPTPRAVCIGIRQTNTAQDVTINHCNINMTQFGKVPNKYVPIYDVLKETIV
jgi:hypothetical protein